MGRYGIVIISTNYAISAVNVSIVEAYVRVQRDLGYEENKEIKLEVVKLKGVYKPKQREFEKVWGAETWLCNTDHYCGKILHLNKGYRCSIHSHKIKDETFYILYGKVLMEHDG